MLAPVAPTHQLVAAGADPSVPTAKPAMNDRFQQGGVRSADASRDHSGLPAIPTAGPDIPPLLAASGAGYGEGFAGNAHRFAPSGMLAAVKYLIEDLGTDPNVRDADGNTALHHAAARGDNEVILYLVSKGADVTVVARNGQTTADMANGPVQRVSPFPATVALRGIDVGALLNERAHCLAVALHRGIGNRRGGWCRADGDRQREHREKGKCQSKSHRVGSRT